MEYPEIYESLEFQSLSMIVSLCIAVSLYYQIVQGAISSDEINGQDLPGWNKPLPSKQYSGYIEVDTGRYLHYWFVESEQNPETAPVVLWMNGGPGCSSLDGYFNEMGPLHFNRSGYTTGLPQLIYNQWTWTKIVNMIFLEAPAGVGFSYSDNPARDYVTDDAKTAKDNYNFLLRWFKSYSEYHKNDFYITGESYAGIYVPTLVHLVMEMNEQQPPENRLNLKGFAVGNGCIGSEVGSCSMKEGIKIHVDFYHGHGLFPDDLYSNITKTCNYEAISKACHDLLMEMSLKIGKVNMYDIYDNCFMNLSAPYSRISNPLKSLFNERNLKSETPMAPLGPLDCIDDHVEKSYCDDTKVREALHVAPYTKIGGWSLCTGRIHYNWSTTSLLPIYPTLIKQYRTLIYNGDVDGAVPYIGNEQWTSGLGFEVQDPWRPWMLNDQVAGYVTAYNVNGFKFVTVKGAGHMVPRYKPEAAFYMFQRYILGLDF